MPPSCDLPGGTDRYCPMRLPAARLSGAEAGPVTSCGCGGSSSSSEVSSELLDIDGVGGICTGSGSGCGAGLQISSSLNPGGRQCLAGRLRSGLFFVARFLFGERLLPRASCALSCGAEVPPCADSGRFLAAARSKGGCCACCNGGGSDLAAEGGSLLLLLPLATDFCWSGAWSAGGRWLLLLCAPLTSTRALFFEGERAVGDGGETAPARRDREMGAGGKGKRQNFESTSTTRSASGISSPMRSSGRSSCLPN